MPITRFLDDHPFDPETVDLMSKVLVAACSDLGMKPGPDDKSRLIASRIIALARKGVRDPALLKAAGLQGIGN